jgi:RNA polymerase sigma-70 factor (ECF subfamily)
MSIAQTMTGDFHTDLKANLPRLRVYALSLARHRDHADDLVQQTVVKALAGRNSFRPGTNFAAWLFRIQRNEFVSGLRRARPTVCLDDAISNTLSHLPNQENGLIMREFIAAFHRLAKSQREALLLAVLEGYSYAKIAEHCSVSVGTIKSRISRARASLAILLTGDGEDRRPSIGGHGAHVRAVALAEASRGKPLRTVLSALAL